MRRVRDEAPFIGRNVTSHDRVMSDGDEQVVEEKLRLRKLIEHWAHHNDEHAERFLESVETAERLQIQGVAREMRLAAERSGEVSKHLRNALKHLGEGRRV